MTWIEETRENLNVRTESLFKDEGFPDGAVVKNPPANAGDMGSSPGPGRSHMPQSNYWACALEPTSHNYWSLRT